MPRFKVCSALLVFAFVAFCSSLSATNVLQMNLQEMVNRADRIFRGTVLDVREGTVTAGGGELPVVTYRIRVDEALKGTFEEVKGVQIAEVRMLGKLKPGQNSSVRTLVSIPDLPQLQVGHEYLLLVTPRSSVGLSTTVGLGQGLFELQGKDGQEVAVNGNKNYGLFLGISGSSAASSVNRTAASQEDGGALPYEGLAALIRDFVGE
jgi:hypothetical protein